VVEGVRVRVVLHVEALHVGLEEEAPDLGLVLDQVALRRVVATLTMLRCKAEVDEGDRAQKLVLGDDLAPQRTRVIHAGPTGLDGLHHVEHARKVVLGRTLDVVVDVVLLEPPLRQHPEALLVDLRVIQRVCLLRMVRVKEVGLNQTQLSA